MYRNHITHYWNRESSNSPTRWRVRRESNWIQPKQRAGRVAGRVGEWGAVASREVTSILPGVGRGSHRESSLGWRGTAKNCSFRDRGNHLRASHSSSQLQFIIFGKACRDRKFDKFPFQCFTTLTAKKFFLITKPQAAPHSLNAFSFWCP